MPFKVQGKSPSLDSPDPAENEIEIPDLSWESDPCLTKYLEELCFHIYYGSFPVEPFHRQFVEDVSRRGIWSDSQRELALEILSTYWAEARMVIYSPENHGTR